MKTIDGLILPSDELQKRYARTYVEVYLKKAKKKEVIYFRDFGGNQVAIYREDGESVVLADDDYDIIRDFPRLGAINWKGHVHYLSRIPLRQWRRGFYEEVIEDFNREGDHNFRHLSRQKAQAVFNPKYPDSFEQALKQVSEDGGSVAMNHTYWISKDGERIYFWRKKVPVGEIKDGVVFFFSGAVSLKQEAKDYLGEKYVLEV